MPLNDSNNTDGNDNTLVRIAKGDQLDSLGRHITTSPITIFNSVALRDKQPEYWDESLTGSGTSVFNNNNNTINMSVTTASGDRVVRQTLRRFLYLTGHGMRVSWTGRFATPKTNLRQRVGYFDANDGIFIQNVSGTYSVVIRSFTSGAVVENSVPRSSWADKLDGTGRSGLNIDFTKRQLFVINFAWQGVGKVRFGVIYDSETVYFHEIEHGNTSLEPYMQTPNLPFRIEIENIGVTSSASTLAHTCTTIEREGAGNPTRVARSISTDITARTVGSTDYSPVLALRAGGVSASEANAIIDLISASLYVTGNSDISYKVIINPTLTGAVWTDVPGFCQQDISATSFTGGTVIDSGYIRSQTSTVVNNSKIVELAANQIGRLINGTTTPIVIVARCFSGNASCYASIDYTEI